MRRARDHVNSRQALPRCRLITKSSELTSDYIRASLSKSGRPINGTLTIDVFRSIAIPSIEVKSKFNLSAMLEIGKLGPVKPIRTKAREELKSLGGAPRVEKHIRTEDTHGPAWFPPTSFQVYQQHWRPWRWGMTRCHAAAAEEDEEEDDDGLCSAWKGVLEGRERDRERRRERDRAREFERSNYNRVRVRESLGIIIMNT